MPRGPSFVTMFWNRARMASRGVASSMRMARQSVPRSLAFSLAVGGTALALAQPPLLLETTDSKRKSWAERTTRPPTTITRTRVEVEEEEAEEEEAEEKAPAADAPEEDEQQSAFDERTGEINWDCPCLGGMADGPCGEEFKQAFSCFIFSEEEPKGIECVDKFKHMQDCFRKHPEIYAEEIEADNIAEAEVSAEANPEALQEEE